MIDNAIAQTTETQASITPKQALDLLMDGNQRFLDNKPLQRNLHQQVYQTSTNGQHPFAVVLGCIDSRVPAETVFDQGIGDIFNCRIAGNFVNDDILGSMEFSCRLAGSKLILVLGHSACGAVKGACDHAQLGNLTQMLDKIMPAVNAVKTPEGTDRSSKNSVFVQQVVDKNVQLAIENIRSRSTVLREMEEDGEIMIAGGCYDVSTGAVTLY